MHKATSTDDKRLQSTLKRLGVNTIPGIEEVNLFQTDGNVVHFVNPKGELRCSAIQHTVTINRQTTQQAACKELVLPDGNISCVAVQASIAANTYVVNGESKVQSKLS